MGQRIFAGGTLLEQRVKMAFNFDKPADVRNMHCLIVDKGGITMNSHNNRILSISDSCDLI